MIIITREVRVRFECKIITFCNFDEAQKRTGDAGKGREGTGLEGRESSLVYPQLTVLDGW